MMSANPDRCDPSRPDERAWNFQEARRRWLHHERQAQHQVKIAHKHACSALRDAEMAEWSPQAMAPLRTAVLALARLIEA